MNRYDMITDFLDTAAHMRGVHEVENYTEAGRRSANRLARRAIRRQWAYHYGQPLLVFATTFAVCYGIIGLLARLFGI